MQHTSAHMTDLSEPFVRLTEPAHLPYRVSDRRRLTLGFFLFVCFDGGLRLAPLSQRKIQGVPERKKCHRQETVP